MSTQSSQDRKRFGVSKAPIPTTRAFVKDIEHFKNQTPPIHAQAWILMDEREGTRVSVNTYDGNAGKGFVAQPHPIPADEKSLHQLTKGYTEVDPSTCPVAEVVAKPEVAATK